MHAHLYYIIFQWHDKMHQAILWQPDSRSTFLFSLYNSLSNFNVQHKGRLIDC